LKTFKRDNRQKAIKNVQNVQKRLLHLWYRYEAARNDNRQNLGSRCWNAATRSVVL